MLRLYSFFASNSENPRRLARVHCFKELTFLNRFLRPSSAPAQRTSEEVSCKVMRCTPALLLLCHRVTRLCLTSSAGFSHVINFRISWYNAKNCRDKLQRGQLITLLYLHKSKHDSQNKEWPCKYQNVWIRKLHLQLYQLLLWLQRTSPFPFAHYDVWQPFITLVVEHGDPARSAAGGKATTYSVQKSKKSHHAKFCSFMENCLHLRSAWFF